MQKYNSCPAKISGVWLVKCSYHSIRCLFFLNSGWRFQTGGAEVSCRFFPGATRVLVRFPNCQASGLGNLATRVYADELISDWGGCSAQGGANDGPLNGTRFLLFLNFRETCPCVIWRQKQWNPCFVPTWLEFKIGGWRHCPGNRQKLLGENIALRGSSSYVEWGLGEDRIFS